MTLLNQTVMNKKLFLLPVVAGALCLTLSSYNSGYTSNATGSDGLTGSSVGCGAGTGCHSTTATTGIMGIQTFVVLDSAGTFVTRYKPGVTYKLWLIGLNSTGVSLPKFGFQLSAVKGTGTSATQAGTFSGLPSNMSSNTDAGGRIYLGHNNAWNASRVTIGSFTVDADSVFVNWTAPAASSGTVSVFGVINQINADGNNTSADKWDTVLARFTELPAPSAVNEVSKAFTAVVYPNPAINSVNIKIENVTDGNYAVSIFDMYGKRYVNTTIDFRNSATSLAVDNLPAGIYNVVVSKDGAQFFTSLMKQ
jgi:hypothetical protein